MGILHFDFQDTMKTAQLLTLFVALTACDFCTAGIRAKRTVHLARGYANLLDSGSECASDALTSGANILGAQWQRKTENSVAQIAEAVASAAARIEQISESAAARAVAVVRNALVPANKDVDAILDQAAKNIQAAGEKISQIAQKGLEVDAAIAAQAGRDVLKATEEGTAFIRKTAASGMKEANDIIATAGAAVVRAAQESTNAAVNALLTAGASSAREIQQGAVGVQNSVQSAIQNSGSAIDSGLRAAAQGRMAATNAFGSNAANLVSGLFEAHHYPC